MNIKRQRNQSSFDRSVVSQVENIPSHEINAVIDKVEIIADNFKLRRQFRRTMCVYFLIILLCVAGCAIKHHMRRGPGGRFERFPRHFMGPSRLGEKGPQREGSTMQGHQAQMHGPKNIPGFPEVPQSMPPRQEEAMPAGPGRRHHRGHRGHGRRHYRGPHRRHHNKENKQYSSVPPVAEQKVAAETSRKVDTTLPLEKPEVQDSQTNPRTLQSIEPAQTSPSAPGPNDPVQNGNSPAASSDKSYARPEPNNQEFRPRCGEKYQRRPTKGGNYKGSFRRRHHRGMHIIGNILILLLVIPGIICLIFRCKRKRVLNRVNKILEIENRRFVAKYGCEWSINRKMTSLSLNRVAGTSLGYPVQPLYPQSQVEHTPFCHQLVDGPMFAELSTAGRHQPARGYVRVALDDSAVCYR